MPFAVGQLIEGRKNPITVKLEDTIKHILNLMIENDFSQLPVIDESGKPLGIVTSDSILRAINNFGVSVDALKATHALIKVDEYSVDEDLFDLLEDLKESYAVLIVNSEHRLVGIVTSYDTTEYFRRRAEDMMYVEDIESTLKDFILASFPQKNGEPDADELNAALKDMMGNDLSKKFVAALHYYFQQDTNDASAGKKVDVNLVKQAFDKFFMPHKQTKTFDDLTLHEYIQLLLHKNRWEFFEPIFALQPSAINKLLNEVRKTRNDLAHFHGEITPQQRDQLHFCADWLALHQIKIVNPSSVDTSTSDLMPTNQTENSVPLESAEIKLTTPVEEQVGVRESRYTLLAQWLRQQPTYLRSIKYTFNQIEEIIGDELPTSARKHRAWWANDSVGHVQSRQWLDAGWRVSTIDMTNETITFTRIKEREEAYIDFLAAYWLNCQWRPLLALMVIVG